MQIHILLVRLLLESIPNQTVPVFFTEKGYRRLLFHNADTIHKNKSLVHKSVVTDRSKHKRFLILVYGLLLIFHLI